MKQLSVKNKLRQAHANMMARCYTKSSKSYKTYGAKGVAVCKEWHDFRTFLYYCIDNYWYDGCHISRKGDLGNYEPGNVYIVTAEENRLEAGIRRGKKTICIETGIEFYSVKDAARWIKKNNNLDSKIKTIAENIRCKGLKGSTSYGYTWEVVQ